VGYASPVSTSGYRQAHRACPSCGVPLDEQLHEGVHVDVCPDCSGVWIDWMDGDIGQVSAKLEVPAAQTRGSEGTGACPVCGDDLGTEVLGAVRIQRCGSCAGAWLDRATLHALQHTGDDDDIEIPMEDPWLTRVLDAIGRFLTPG